MVPESNLEYSKNTISGSSLSTVSGFAKNLGDRASVMETHGWIKEAAATRKWAHELRAYLVNQNYSPDL
jgi:hypothetical protein